MKTKRPSWKSLGITRKFSLVFALVLALVLLIGVTSYSSFLYISKMEEKIFTSNKVAQLVLDMDRGMEKARRLHSDFFIQYQHIGLQKAHELYAQPSVGEATRVISLSSRLKELLFQNDNPIIPDVQRLEVNLYLASAKRFADTSIDAVELVFRRSSPERGLETKLSEAGTEMRRILQNHPELLSLLFEARSAYKDYLIYRQRPRMQTTLNLLHAIETKVAEDTSYPPEIRDSLPEKIQNMVHLAGELVEVDLAINAKFNDFSLQVWALSPVSESLAKNAKAAVVRAEANINRAYLTANSVILVSLVLAILTILYIARLVHTDITRNVLALTSAAGSFRDGNLQIRVPEPTDDELGQLARSFNDMADRLSDLIENLEKKVTQRTTELSLSEERFRRLVNELPQIAVQGFNEEHRIVYWNLANVRMFGYSAAEARGKIFEELIFPKAQQNSTCQMIDRWLDFGEEPSALEQTLHDKQGREIPVHSAYAMQTNNLGERTIYCIHINLAELKTAEEKSKISESFYRQLFDHSSSAVAVYEAVNEGRDFIFKDFNRAGEEIEQISREEVIGRSLTEVFPGMADYGLPEVLLDVWQTGIASDFPEKFYHDRRIQGWRENKVYKLPTGEVVTVYNDITGRKQVEEEREVMKLRLQRAQKMEAIGLMAGGIAHDLNNILSAIIGYPELLLQQLQADSELRKPLVAVKEAGERAAMVVTDLLTVARGVATARSEEDVNTLVLEYLESPEFHQLQKLYPNVHFARDLATELPLIACSAVHLKKCLMNLASNGAEAIDSTGTVTFRSTLFEASRRWRRKHGLETNLFVRLSVINDGPGIDPHHREHIFEPFYTKKVMGQRSGTGLGLSVVWNTMKEHGGVVLVDSNENGSAFHLYFPASEEYVTPAKREVTTEPIQGKGESILVIDDEPLQCDLAKSMLEHFGCSVVTVPSGEEAIRYLSENKVDLLLLDMLMEPGMNGRETYRRIIEIHPGQPALIASGFSESEDVRATLAMGAGSFIKKPYSMEELGRTVQRELAKLS